ncbi:MAG: TlpA family protein disulfide reductase [Acidobacteria bacterium]|nr:TlpA family protein disulfide reductase [Acidobacteriota bacterium]
MPSAFLSCALRSRVALIIGALSLLLFFAACGASAPGEVGRSETPKGRTAPPTSFPMPPTTTGNGSLNAQSFTLLDNQQAKLSDYLGQVVVLDFWATFCAPCVEEAPHLDALQKRFGAQGLQVIGLNVGGPDDYPGIPEFAARLKINYKLGIPEPEMMNLYMGSNNAIPQTIVFDRKGRIVKHFVGYDQTTSAELERTIEKTVTSGE